METPGKRSSEYLLTSGAGKAGIVGVLITLVTALLQDGGLSEISLTWPTAALLIAVVLALAAIIVSYNISRGLAKIENRVQNPEPPA